MTIRIILILVIIGLALPTMSVSAQDFGLGNLSQYSYNRQVGCDDNPDHSFCNGKRGQDGYIFCTLRDELSSHMNLTCWDDDEYNTDDPLIYCATDPETKEDCKIN